MSEDNNEKKQISVTDEELSIHSKKWIRIGTSVGPGDRESTNKAIRDLWVHEGLGEPIIAWFESPMAMIDHVKSLGVTEFSDVFFWGSFEAYWISFYDFFQGRVINDPAVDYLATIASNCGPMACFESHVFVSERPSDMLRDDRGDLHSEEGPAMSWSDGTAHYYWHGTSIPAEWIEEKDKLDPKLALTHENTELRRCVGEILGWGRVLDLLNPTIIDVDDDPMVGTLMEVELEGRNERFIQVRCGTGRDFTLPVPPDMETALEANAWTYGLDKDELRKYEVRT